MSHLRARASKVLCKTSKMTMVTIPMVPRRASIQRGDDEDTKDLMIVLVMVMREKTRWEHAILSKLMVMMML